MSDNERMHWRRQQPRGTLRRVAAPRFTRDIGASNIMRTIFALTLACLACSCGHDKPDNTVLSAWLISTTNGIRTEICYTALSNKQMDSLFQLAAKSTGPETHLILYLSPGVDVTNANWLLDSAENHGITNITVELNKTRPPSPNIGVVPIDYETKN